jgi:hypothetical protein
LRLGEFIAVMILRRSGWETAIARPTSGDVGRLCLVGFGSFAAVLDLRRFAWVAGTSQPSLFVRLELIH